MPAAPDCTAVQNLPACVNPATGENSTPQLSYTEHCGEDDHLLAQLYAAEGCDSEIDKYTICCSADLCSAASAEECCASPASFVSGYMHCIMLTKLQLDLCVFTHCTALLPTFWCILPAAAAAPQAPSTQAVPPTPPPSTASALPASPADTATGSAAKSAGQQQERVMHQSCAAGHLQSALLMCCSPAAWCAGPQVLARLCRHRTALAAAPPALR